MTRFRRVSAAIAAALLLFSMQADVYASSHCEHHAVQAAAETSGHGHHDAGPPAETNHAICTCLGMCAASTPAAEVSVSVAAFALPCDVVSFIASEETVLPGFTHHLIPFATAPPVVS